RGRTLRLHGAEHRAIAPAELHCLVATWRGERGDAVLAPLRHQFRRAPGPGLTALRSPLGAPSGAALASARDARRARADDGDLDRGTARSAARGRFVMLPGLALQRLTTREPALEDTRVALRALAGLLAADGSAWKNPC